MPAPLYTQTVIACVWDYDRTLIPDNMQGPIFDEYDVDPGAFWDEVEGLVDFHGSRGEIVASDKAYLLHILAYVEAGIFEGLNNAKLRELGAAITPCPGIPEFFEATKQRVGSIPEFVREGITVEHHVVSTGLRPIIEGSPIAPHVDGIWANTFIESSAGPGYRDRLPVGEQGSAIKYLSYSIDNTSKSRAIFEINKGVNVNPQTDVNALMAESQRRVPLRNMIYIADGPSDVPVFSILNQAGGKTLGVYVQEPRTNHRQVKQLQEQGRIQGMAEADYREGEGAYLWLMDSIEQIGYEIVENRRQAFAAIPNPPGHT